MYSVHCTPFESIVSGVDRIVVWDCITIKTFLQHHYDVTRDTIKLCGAGLKQRQKKIHIEPRRK